MTYKNHANKYLSCLLVSLSIPVSAIVPINDKIIPEQGMSGKFGFELNGQSGNKDEQEYGVDGLLRYRQGENLFVFLGDLTYSETNDVRDEDELFLHARWVGINKISDFIDPEIFIQYQYDDFADISDRELVGGNIRWRNEVEGHQLHSQLILAAGLFFETETSVITNITDDTVRVNLYGRYLYENKSEFPYMLSLSTYIQPATDDVSDVRVLALGALEYPIRPNLSVAFEVEVKHNSTPFDDVEKTDIEYGVSLNYSF